MKINKNMRKLLKLSEYDEKQQKQAKNIKYHINIRKTMKRYNNRTELVKNIKKTQKTINCVEK